MAMQVEECPRYPLPPRPSRHVAGPIRRSSWDVRRHQKPLVSRCWSPIETRKYLSVKSIFSQLCVPLSFHVFDFGFQVDSWSAHASASLHIAFGALFCAYCALSLARNGISVGNPDRGRAKDLFVKGSRYAEMGTRWKSRSEGLRSVQNVVDGNDMKEQWAGHHFPPSPVRLRTAAAARD